MGKVKQIDIKNWTCYFYNDQINLKDFDASLLKVDKKDYKEIDIYYIGYVTVKKIANCNNINSVNLCTWWSMKWLVALKKKVEISI